MSVIWGNDTSAPSGTIQSTKVMYFGLDALTEEGVLKTLFINCYSNTFADDPRIALYKGVSSGTVSGATLVRDFGQISADGSGDYSISPDYGVDVDDEIVLESGVEYWIGIKFAQSSGSCGFGYDTADVGESLNTCFYASDESTDETDAWDATVSNPSDQLSRSHRCHLEYIQVTKRYVHTHADASGDGTTPETSSGGTTHAYQNLSAALNAEAADITAATGSDKIVRIYSDGDNDTSTFDDSGTSWLTSSGNYIEVIAVREHYGLWQDGLYNHSTFADLGLLRLRSGIRHIRLTGLQCGIDTASTAMRRYIRTEYPASQGDHEIILDRCLFRITGSSTGDRILIDANSFNSGNTFVYKLRNCGFITDGYTGTGTTRNAVETTLGVSNASWYIHNCTFRGAFTDALKELGSGTYQIYNCAFDITGGGNDLSGTWTGNYNATTASSGLPGANSRHSQSFTWAGVTNSVRLHPDDAGAAGFGTDLSGDSNLAVTEDMSEYARPGTGVDIGCWESRQTAWNNVIRTHSFYDSGGALGPESFDTTGCNLLLAILGGTLSFSAASFNSDPMTEVGSLLNYGGNGLSIFYLENPDQGSYSLSATRSSTTNSSHTLIGLNVPTPAGAVNTTDEQNDSGTGVASIQDSISSADGDLIISAIGIDYGQAPVYPDAGQIEVSNRQAFTDWYAVSVKDGEASSTTCGWDWDSSGDYALRTLGITLTESGSVFRPMVIIM